MIFIIASPRSGSHALRSILGQESLIKNFGEVFNHDTQHVIPGNFSEFFLKEIDKKREWKYNSKTSSELIKVYISYLKFLAANKMPLLDVKDGHLRCLDWPGPNRELNSRPLLLETITNLNFPIIRLTRSNWLAQYISEFFAIRSNVWVLNHEQNNKKNDSVYISKDSLQNRFMEFEHNEILVAKWLNRYQNFIDIKYEDMLLNSSLTLRTRQLIGSLLGFELNNSLKSTTFKILPSPRDTISNYQEVCDWLKDSEYRKFLLD
jgi:hypothetical protein